MFRHVVPQQVAQPAQSFVEGNDDEIEEGGLSSVQYTRTGEDFLKGSPGYKMLQCKSRQTMFKTQQHSFNSGVPNDRDLVASSSSPLNES